MSFIVRREGRRRVGETFRNKYLSIVVKLRSLFSTGFHARRKRTWHLTNAMQQSITRYEITPYIYSLSPSFSRLLSRSISISLPRCHDYLTQYWHDISFDPNSGSTGTNVIKRRSSGRREIGYWIILVPSPKTAATPCSRLTDR